LKKPDTVADAEAALLRIKDGYKSQEIWLHDLELIMGVLKRLERAVQHAAHAEHEKKQMLAIAKTVLNDE
jgi:hypothetical protein